MKKEEILDIFKQAGVLLEGHFLLTSGKHSGRYLQCARLFQDARYSEPICHALAERFRAEPIDAVIGPAMGAVQMAYEMGRQLSCPNFFAERENGEMTLRRGFTVTPGMRVLVVEDVITTGGSVREVMDLVSKAGGIVAGVGAVVDRTGGKIDFGVPFRAVLSIEVEAYSAEECPMCASGAGAPVKPGSRGAR